MPPNRDTALLELAVTVSGVHYNLYGTLLTWNEAKAWCEGNGQSVLADFISSSEYLAVARAASHWVQAQAAYGEPVIQMWSGYNAVSYDTFGNKLVLVANGSSAASQYWVPSEYMFSGLQSSPECASIVFSTQAQAMFALASNCNATRMRPLCRSTRAALSSATPTGPAAGPLPVRSLYELRQSVSYQIARGAYVYTLLTDPALRASFMQAQAMCQFMPGAPGTLATIYTLEDLNFFADVAARAEGDAPNVWVGAGDFLSPDSPYWSIANLDVTANGLAPGWLDDPDRVGNETAACAFLDTSARPPRLRRAACSSRFAVLCMSSNVRGAPQHVALAEVTGDGLPDVVVATNCPWDNGASIIALQQPSPSQAVLQAGPDADTLITPSMSVRMCGDGIPIWQREECDMGVDGTRICDESCRVTPRYVVHASAREAFITVGDGDLTLDHWGVNYNLYGQVRGFSDLREAPTDPLLYPGFFANSADNVCPASQPVPVHRVKNLAAGYPFQYRAFLRTDLSTPALPTWTDVESASASDPSFTNATSSCGCTPDNPGGQPVNLTVAQQFQSIAISWVVGSACEAGVSVTRSLINPLTGLPLNTTTVAQLSIGLECSAQYRPSKTEIDEDIVRDDLQVGLTYRYCVVVASAASSAYFLNASDPLNPDRFVSQPECRDVTIQWAGRLTGEVRTKFDTPAPGIRLTARLIGSPYVVSGITDDSGRYELTLQTNVPNCDPIVAPETCVNQLIRLTASSRTKLRSGRIIPHQFSINNRLGAAQTLALAHLQVQEGVRILDETSLPVAGFVRWPGTPANSGYNQPRGCPIRDAQVCAVNHRDNVTISCATSDPDGSFLVVAGIGAYVRLTAKYGNHSFAINMPGGLPVEDTGAFEIMAPVYDVDIRNTQTRTLRVGLVGGLCRYALGKPQLQFTAYQCEDQSGQRPLYRRVDLDPAQPYTDLVLPALAWEVQYVDVKDPIPDLNTQAVFQYLLITNQISKFANLSANTDSAAPPTTLTWEFLAPNDIEVDVCRNVKGNAVLCGDMSLTRQCAGTTSAAAIKAVYDAFQPPDSALVGKDVVLLRRGAQYKMRMRLFGQYGRLRCDNVSASIFMQDSISGEVETNRCSVKNRGCSNEVDYQTITNTSEYMYDLVPLAINFGAMTAYSSPLSIVAESTGWPSRSFLLYSIVEGTEDRLGTGYIEVPIPVPLLILRDPPGDRSYATLDSSISTAVKLSMVNHDHLTCGGPNEKEILTKALPVRVNLLNALPTYKFTRSPEQLAKGMAKHAEYAASLTELMPTEKLKIGFFRKRINRVKELFSMSNIKRTMGDVLKSSERNLFKLLKGGYKYATSANDGASAYDSDNDRPADPAKLEQGRGGALTWRELGADLPSSASGQQVQDKVKGVIEEIFKQADADVDPELVLAGLEQMLDMDEARPEELMALLVKRVDEFGKEMAASSRPLDVNLRALTVAFSKDPYSMGPGSRSVKGKDSAVPEYYRSEAPDFELNPSGLDAIQPQCAKSTLGIGFDIDMGQCAGLGVSVCAPLLRDRGQAGIVTEKAWYNDEEEDSSYKLTITRAEGFSTPKESTPELVGGDADMILAPTFAIMFTLQDRLQFDTKTCTPTATMGIPGWNVREDAHGTAWHSVWHIKNVVVPELQKRLAGEQAKAAAAQNPSVINNLKEGMAGWQNILKVYNDLNALATEREEELPSYQLEQQDVNGLTQGTIEGIWHTTLDDHPDRHMEAYEGRTIDWERLEKSPVWKQGYFEGAEKLQSLMLRTQRYMDASATRGNVVLRPHQKAAVGGIVAGKQLDQLNRVYGTNFNTFSFSGGGGSYTYSLTSASTLSTKIGFSISFKDMFGFQGGGGGGTGFWMESYDENLYGFELEFNSQLLQETERERVVTVHFEDKDVGDSFLVKIRPDTAYGTPMFELLAGRSKCPYEPGTLQRELARVSVLGGLNVQQNIKQGDSTVYELLIENRSGTDEPVAMQLGPDLATNNANMQLQLMGAPWIEPVPYKLRGPIATQTKAVVTARCGPRYLTSAVDIVSTGTCDAAEFSRTPLTLKCYSVCPEVRWPQAWPLTVPLIYNATDALNKRNITLTLFNPNYATQKWATHPRLATNVTMIQIEYVNTVSSGGLWTPVRSLNGSAVNFAKIEDAAFGFATFQWPAWQFLTSEGDYLLRYVVYCDILVGGGMDSRYEGSPISLHVDRTTPWPVHNSLTPYDMTYLPGDEIYVDFSEPLDCRQPFAFWWLGLQADGLANRTFSQQTGDFIPTCSGRRISFSWNPFNRPTPLTNGQNVSLQLGGVRDLAGNVQTRAVNITFVTGTLAPNAPIRLNFAMGPLPTTVRRLLFANGPGAAGSSLPHQLPHRLALRDYTEESLAAELASRLAARRRLLAELNALLGECLGPWPRGPEAPGVVASSVVQDEDVATMVVELQAFGILESEEEDRVGSGEDAGLGGPRKDAVWVAERLVAAAADNTSCLATRLQRAYAPVRSVFAHRSPERQLLDGWSSEEVAVARRRAAAEARAKGLPGAWLGAVQSLQAEAQAAAEALAQVAERALKSMLGEPESAAADPGTVSTDAASDKQEPYDGDKQLVAAAGAVAAAAVTSDTSAAALAPALVSGSRRQGTGNEEQQPQVAAVSRRSMVTQQRQQRQQRSAGGEAAAAGDAGVASGSSWLWARVANSSGGGGRGVLLGLLLAGNLVALAAVAGIWRARRQRRRNVATASAVTASVVVQ
ncbi:hypothetical protein CHLRE_01g002861v5 [Chlamydomonas reinhardtii]|uniref:C-type lectin domain-containing protein n=1 Tax=Chlamydomonas reinhardtii TaxID=3055 RepID=A0A2K3E4Z2_CHLRE|nr:uncharacterized protein CHLRE_01g002861v5 [Chlamydomonas reinhardtii]PNW87807.1 hypothetical protein CHLRE_01g002861v5 [Chlamydomonas reinhardtii]